MIKLGAIPHRLALSSWLFAGVLGLSGCAFWTDPASEAPPQQILRHLSLQFNAQDKSQWQAMRLPGKLLTAYRVVPQGPRDALLAEAASSASMLKQALHIPPSQLGALKFDWRVDQLIAGADMRQRDAEDSPVRLILVFEGDRQRFSTQNQLLSELTLSLTGEPLPYATLMYVWCNDCPAESVIVNPEPTASASRPSSRARGDWGNGCVTTATFVPILKRPLVSRPVPC
jgi:hypothetical protein